MPTIIVRESAAGNILIGGNLMAGNRFQTSPRFRKIRRIALVGSSAVGTGAMDILYGATVVVNGLSPTTSGVTLPVEAKDILPVASDLICERGESINAIVTTLSVTNPFILLMEIDEF